MSPEQEPQGTALDAATQAALERLSRRVWELLQRLDALERQERSREGQRDATDAADDGQSR